MVLTAGGSLFGATVDLTGWLGCVAGTSSGGPGALPLVGPLLPASWNRGLESPMVVLGATLLGRKRGDSSQCLHQGSGLLAVSPSLVLLGSLCSGRPHAACKAHGHSHETQETKGMSLKGQSLGPSHTGEVLRGPRQACPAAAGLGVRVLAQGTAGS